MPFLTKRFQYQVSPARSLTSAKIKRIRTTPVDFHVCFMEDDSFIVHIAAFAVPRFMAVGTPRASGGHCAQLLVVNLNFCLLLLGRGFQRSNFLSESVGAEQNMPLPHYSSTVWNQNHNIRDTRPSQP